MPCLHTESLPSLPGEGRYGDTSAHRGSQGSQSRLWKNAKSGEKKAPGDKKESEKEKRVITSAGWVFSPLWGPGAKTQRLGFRMGMESERVKAWLDDHSHSARSYFRRSSRHLVNGYLERAQGLKTPRNEPGSFRGRRRVSHPLYGPSRRQVHPTKLERPHSCLNIHQFDESLNLDQRRWHSSRSPQPKSLCSPRPLSSPRTPRPFSYQCRKGESCDFILRLFGGSPGLLQNEDAHVQVLLHLCEITQSQCCHFSMITKDRTGVKNLGPVLQSKKESVSGHTEMEWYKCIMGYVVSTGRLLNIKDACEDPRFQCVVEKGEDRPKSILCVPILNQKKQVMGVVMCEEKRSSGTCLDGFFSEQDEKVLSSHVTLFGLILENSQLYENSEQESKRNQVLLELARLVSHDYPSVDVMLNKLSGIILPVTHAQYCAVFLSNDRTTGFYSEVFHFEFKENSGSVQCTARDCDTNDLSYTYSKHTQNSFKTLSMAKMTSDQHDNNATTTFICAPIIGKPGRDVIGVCQLVNKRNAAFPGNDVFSRRDERLLEDFAVYCALGLEKFIMQQMGDKTRANLDVTKEVLSYQISASQEELQALAEAIIPSADALCLRDFGFSDCDMSQTAMAQAVVRMFLDLNLLQDFSIDYKSLCQWVLSVRKGYRNVAYHNWSHALSTAQCMFAILQAEDELKNNLSSLEVLALIIACLSHDLDHRGVNNSYIERSNQPLAQLYGHSSLEHHHFDMCRLILNNPGSQILSSLSKKDYKACVQMIEKNILATDLTVYLEKRTMFFERAQNSSCLWKDEDHRELLSMEQKQETLTTNTCLLLTTSCYRIN
ncbi:cGMP-specific 3',5'-cyclic phosphodiesterase [Triplophysa tibetana]|uniref:Phosphodiesterase n=1 Tax=Triplophysa tibetana TaxID=1572043 RepID=A0A5A9PMW2_9TELE|nr:cGMP-specific 3',5'-cyclic phosphodiesterase [Triplophysa tibetana]